ncbi:hypothetical protein [Piscinibacter sp.]|jgi:hypothetical protein|uniref:hypothetical protein n=1 Tax=Piscinibacter sp. TaxID=1903157 RepID=UPI00355A70DC
MSFVISDDVQLVPFAQRFASGKKIVIPANAGIHRMKSSERRPSARTSDEWIPAFAGMTAVLGRRVAMTHSATWLSTARAGDPPGR